MTISLSVKEKNKFIANFNVFKTIILSVFDSQDEILYDVCPESEGSSLPSYTIKKSSVLHFLDALDEMINSNSLLNKEIQLEVYFQLCHLNDIVNGNIYNSILDAEDIKPVNMEVLNLLLADNQVQLMQCVQEQKLLNVTDLPWKKSCPFLKFSIGNLDNSFVQEWYTCFKKSTYLINFPLVSKQNAHNKFYTNSYSLLAHDLIHIYNEYIERSLPALLPLINELITNVDENNLADITFVFLYFHEEMPELHTEIKKFTGENSYSPEDLFYNDLKFLLRDIGIDIPKFSNKEKPTRVNNFIILGVLQTALNFYIKYNQLQISLIIISEIDKYKALINSLDVEITKNDYSSGAIATWKKSYAFFMETCDKLKEIRLKPISMLSNNKSTLFVSSGGIPADNFEKDSYKLCDNASLLY